MQIVLIWSVSVAAACFFAWLGIERAEHWTGQLFCALCAMGALSISIKQKD